MIYISPVLVSVFYRGGNGATSPTIRPTSIGGKGDTSTATPDGTVVYQVLVFGVCEITLSGPRFPIVSVLIYVS